MLGGLPFPLDPVVGAVVRGWAYNGKSWVKARGAEWTNVQVFTASGRYEPAEDLLYAIVECIGPGGGGGWASGDLDGVTIYATAAGGGGSGGYSRKTFPAELVIQGADVIVGAGGIVGIGQVGGGNTAGITSFGGLCLANGGGDAQAFDGTGTVAAAHGLAGIGAAPGVGDIALPGASGGMWAAIKVNLAVQHLDGVVPGLGGQLYGGAQWPPRPWLYTNAPGMNGLPNSGAGGGGGQVQGGSQATMVGGQGGSGVCIVTEICGTEGSGPTEPIDPIPPGWPPGVPFRVDVRAKVMKVPYDPAAVPPSARDK